MQLTPKLLQITKTATDDNVFKLCVENLWFQYLDIFVYTNNAYVGDIGDQQALVLANDIYYTLFPVNLFDFYFKNGTAGSNTKIVAMGVLLSDKQIKELGVATE